MRKLALLFAAAVIPALFLAGTAFTDDNLITNYTMEMISGAVDVSHDSGTNWLGAEVYMEIGESDLVRTGPSSYCEITLPGDSGSVRVIESSLFSIAKGGKDTRAKVSSGKALFDIVKKLASDESFQVETGTAVLAVRGTEFLAESDPAAGGCSVIHGQVAVTRNIDADGDENFRKEANQSFTAVIGENQQIEYTRAENRDLETRIRNNRGNSGELHRILDEQRNLLHSRMHTIRDREMLDSIVKRHQDDRNTIFSRRPMLRQRRNSMMQQRNPESRSKQLKQARQVKQKKQPARKEPAGKETKKKKDKRGN